MINLLRANLYYIKKSIFFWVILTITFFLSIYIFFNNYFPNCVDCPNQLGASFFGFNTLNHFIGPIAICLFIGALYSEGAIRNRITIGHSRTNIYLANLITSITISLIYILIYIITISIIGLIFQEGIGLTVSQMLILLFDSFLLCVALSSIFTFLSMLVANKTISIIFFIAFILLSLELEISLAEKLSLLDSTSLSYKIYEFFYHLLPMNQASSLFSAPLRIVESSGMEKYNFLWIYSLILSVVLTIIGILLFKKKNIR